MSAKKARDPFAVLSRRVGQSVENNPEVEAIRNGQSVVPNTWGGYATKALDLGICEANRDQIVWLFGGEELVDLRSTEILFRGRSGEEAFGDYENRFKSARHKFYFDDLKIEVRRLRTIFNEITSQWKVSEEESDRLGNLIQAEIDSGIEDSLDETLIALLCIKRDAVWDGYQVDLQTFCEAILGCNVLDEENPSELARYWVNGINKGLQRLFENYRYFKFEGITLSQIFVSRDIMESIIDELDWGSYKLACEYADHDWNHIAPVFNVAPAHRTLTGDEV